jgi:hypothetical protein
MATIVAMTARSGCNAALVAICGESITGDGKKPSRDQCELLLSTFTNDAAQGWILQ